MENTAQQFTCSTTNWGVTHPYISLAVVVFIVLISIYLITKFISSRKYKASSEEDRSNSPSFRNSLILNPEEGLSSQALFWLAIFVPIILFITLGFFSWFGCDFQLSSQAFMNFLLISKFQLAILALSLPFGLMITRLHGTQQTADQLKKAARQIEIAEQNLSNTKNNEIRNKSEKKVENLFTTFNMFKPLIEEEVNRMLMNYSVNKNGREKYSLQDSIDMIETIISEQTASRIVNKDISYSEIIQLCQLIQGANFVYESIRNEKNKYKEAIMDEHLWLINAEWLTIQKPTQVAYFIAKACMEKYEDDRFGKGLVRACNWKSLDKELKELYIYITAFDNWSNDEARRYFGFVIGNSKNKSQKINEEVDVAS
ncbi:hypothetical protein [Photobacterium sp. GB-3]|uniref:hypothetical protein n=1 Tax=Photobacterium sp. GB-3 TaxID=2022110 RepID=UPI000D161F28|nr:hypothetical protein [Photobacterium sp. GB-3]PSV56751.1 hypothetical protein C9J43_09935 [Photobacterium sp. GB-3]